MNACGPLSAGDLKCFDVPVPPYGGQMEKR